MPRSEFWRVAHACANVALPTLRGIWNCRRFWKCSMSKQLVNEMWIPVHLKLIKHVPRTFPIRVEPAVVNRQPGFRRGIRRASAEYIDKAGIRNLNSGTFEHPQGGELDLPETKIAYVCNLIRKTEGSGRGSAPRYNPGNLLTLPITPFLLHLPITSSYYAFHI